MNRHTKQQIKLEMQKQHKALCYEYKNATSLEEVVARYAAICSWWYSSRLANVIGLQELEN
jgi:hypothetical protein